MRPRSRPLTLACLGLASACQLPQNNTSSFTTNVMLTSAPSTGDENLASSTSTTAPTPDTSTTAEDPSTHGSTDDPGPVLDVGTRHDAGTGAPEGCKGKIDFLFVISRYGFMQPYQERLLTAFPDFIHTIESRFAGFDYHIMVVDGDPEWGGEACQAKCPMLCEPDYPCDYAPDSCDMLMGTGVVYPAGYLATNKPCAIAGDRRYMITGQPKLEETFTCAAKVGTEGWPWVGGALAAAVDHNLNGPGGCNGGFVRDDALLMVTLISNTYDMADSAVGSEGTVETWREALLTAKNQDPNSIVMLNILDSDHAPGCHPNDRTCLLTRSFPYSLVTDVNDASYGKPFADAVALVDTACAGFVAPN